MVFIDIGGHRGQALEVALNPKYGFDKFIVFEPSTRAITYLKNFNNKKIELYNFGLGNKNKKTILYNSGEPGASIFKSKFKESEIVSKELITLKKASTVLKPYLQDLKVFIRINCEGSEVEIIEELIKSGLLKDSHSFLVDFDILKVNSSYPIENLLVKINNDNLRISRKPYGGGTTRIQVKKWLDIELQNQLIKVSVADALRYKLKFYISLNKRLIKYFSFIPIKLRIRLFKIFKLYKFLE